MKPAAFDYHVPTEISGVLELLGSLSGDVIVLAGGQSLIPVLNMRLGRPDAIIDLNHVPELFKLEIDGSKMRIGAMVRHMTLENDARVAKNIPLIAEAAKFIAHLQIRTRGTFGGSLCNASPASEWTCVVAALDTTLVVQNSAGNVRKLKPEEFFEGPMMTTLEPDELLIEVSIQIPAPNTGWAFFESARRHGDFALAGTAIIVELAEDASISKARVAVCGLSTPGLRFLEVEEYLVGKSIGATVLDDIESLIMQTDEAPEDFALSSESRKKIAATMVQRSLAKAVERAQLART